MKIPSTARVHGCILYPILFALIALAGWLSDQPARFTLRNLVVCAAALLAVRLVMRKPQSEEGEL